MVYAPITMYGLDHNLIKSGVRLAPSAHSSTGALSQLTLCTPARVNVATPGAFLQYYSTLAKDEVDCIEAGR